MSDRETYLHRQWAAAEDKVENLERELIAEREGRELAEAKNRRLEALKDDADAYRELADHIITLFNPPDGEEAELSILCSALDRAFGYVEAQGCSCVGEEPADACGRCAVLGWFQGKAVER